MSLRVSLSRSLRRVSMNSTADLSKIPIKERKFTIAVVGGTCVGKTAILAQFLNKKFVSEHETTIEEVHQIQFKHSLKHGLLHANPSTHLSESERPVTVEIFDTAGDKEYASLRESYKNSVDGFLCVYDITNKDSLLELKEIIEPIVKERRQCIEKPLSVVFVGTKLDLAKSPDSSKDKIVTIKDVMLEFGQLAQDMEDSEVVNPNEDNLDILHELSAKDHEAVKKAFHALIQQVYTKDNLLNMLEYEIELQKAEKKKAIEKSRKTRSVNYGSSPMIILPNQNSPEPPKRKKSVKNKCKQQ